MHKNIQLYIPEPCHEDWNKMSTTQQGRYCESCCKQVIDFTTMSDQQIIDYLSNTKNKTCGRFDHDQLHRPLQKTQHRYWKWILSSLAALFFFSSCSNRRAIVGELVALPKDSCTVKENKGQTMGAVPPNIIPVDTPKVKILGQLAGPKKDVIEDKRKKKNIK